MKVNPDEMTPLEGVFPPWKLDEDEYDYPSDLSDNGVPCCNNTAEKTTAADLLREAADVIEQRGKLRDLPDGERSMARAVACYLALKPQGKIETELDGWTFMQCLKLARATAGTPHIDDWVDQSGYAALAGECLIRNSKD